MILERMALLSFSLVNQNYTARQRVARFTNESYEPVSFSESIRHAKTIQDASVIRFPNESNEPTLFSGSKTPALRPNVYTICSK